MKLHEKIYHLRTEKKLSQGDLAEILGVSRQSVSKWETGASVPDLDKLVKMSDLFGVTMDFLVREEMEQTDIKAENPIENTHKEDEKGDAPQNTVIVKEIFPIRKLFGALLFVSAFIFLFLVWPLSVFAAALGVICFVFRKHTLLWCAWFTYFSMDIYMVTGTGINRKSVFLPYSYSVWGDPYPRALGVSASSHRLDRLDGIYLPPRSFCDDASQKDRFCAWMGCLVRYFASDQFYCFKICVRKDHRAGGACGWRIYVRLRAL